MGSAVSRRNVMGLAWTTPVLLLAVAAPAAAASLDTGGEPATAASNTIRLSTPVVSYPPSSSTARSYTQSGVITQASGVHPNRVKVTVTVPSSGAGVVTVPATVTVTNDYFAFVVNFTQFYMAYAFTVTVEPENEPGVVFAPGGNSVTLTVPAGAFVPPVPGGGGTFTPPPPFGGGPTSTASPTGGPNCEVRRVSPGTKSNPGTDVTFCD